MKNKDDTLNIWGLTLAADKLGKNDYLYLSQLPKQLPKIEWVWAEMDKVWRDLSLDNTKPLKNQAIDLFYKHPVWLMNGVFSSQDPLSLYNRQQISDFIKQMNAIKIADYGAGFGILAREIVRINPQAKIDIIEPYPSAFILDYNKDERNICYVENFRHSSYDLCIAQDVLEHVEDPIGLAFKIALQVKQGGFLIFANSFYPVIECHLPQTFHLRFTFPYIMASMGLKRCPHVKGVRYAKVYKRNGDLSLKRARRYEKVSKVVGPLLNFAAYIAIKLLRI